MDDQIREHLKVVEKRLEDQEKRYDGKIDELIKMIRDLKEPSTSRSTEVLRDSTENNGPQLQRIDGSTINGGNTNSRSLGFTPKLEFPKFDGSGVRNWVKKCVKYFTLCKIPEDQKVDLASLYMCDKAEVWISNYLSIRRQVEWSEFVIDLSARFKDELGSNVVEKFNRLQQNDTIENYIDEFDNLRSLMEQYNHILPDTYFLESFIGGLKPAVKPFVRAFKPVNVTEAIRYARLQEEALLVNTQKFVKSSTYQPYSVTTSSVGNHINAGKPPLLPTPQIKPLQSLSATEKPKPFKFIPAEIRAEKMAKGLCYYCDQKYERGHRCSFKEKQLFTVEIPSCLHEDSGGDEQGESDLEFTEP